MFVLHITDEAIFKVGEVEGLENMEMKWIHYNPDLVVLDDNGKEKERIDLQGISAPRSASGGEGL